MPELDKVRIRVPAGVPSVDVGLRSYKAERGYVEVEPQDADDVRTHFAAAASGAAPAVDGAAAEAAVDELAETIKAQELRAAQASGPAQEQQEDGEA